MNPISITVLTEEDRIGLIPFFEKHFPNCNKGSNFSINDVDVGNVWFIIKDVLFHRLDACINESVYNLHHKQEHCTHYEGIPKDFEGSISQLNYKELSPKFTEKLNSMPKEDIDKWTELDQLRAENEKLRECLMFEISFGNHLQCKIEVKNGHIEVKDAINGWGDNVPLSEIKIEQLLNQ